MVLMFPAFSDLGTVECTNFSITDDNIMEPVESFSVTGVAGNFVGGQDSTQVNIEDNDSEFYMENAYLAACLCRFHRHIDLLRVRKGKSHKLYSN